MAIVYIINFTCPTTPAFALRPGEENGPGSGGIITSSLSLFGMGAQRWGENVNENQLHLLENFAANPITPARDGSSNITLAGAPYPDVYTPGATWKDILDTPVMGQMWYNKLIEGMMLYDGTKWVKMRGANVDPTPDPVHGDLWLDEDFHPAHASLGTTAQLMFWDGTGWFSVSDGYVRRAGDTMYGNLQMIAGAQTIYGNVGSEHMSINEGDGDPDVCPDIHKLVDDLLLASVDTVHVLFDSNDDGVGEFQIRKGTSGASSKNLLTSTWFSRVEQNGTISVNPALNYETLVTDDDDIPNWKRVTDELTGTYLRLDGTNGPMQGNLSMGNFELCGLPNPVSTDDCAVSRAEGNDLWVNIIGDTMTGTLNFSVDGTTTPAICGTTSFLTIASNGGVLIAIDKDNNTASTVDPFIVGMNADNSTTATSLFTIQQDGRILANTASYAALVTSNAVLTNKEYVDTAITAAFVARTGGVSFGGAGERNILVWDRDVFWTGTQLLITRGAGSGTTEIVFPAQYTP